jgi:ketosteroid isomerase-like protein
MGTGENPEIVRRGYAAFTSGDIETLTALFDKSASWHTPGRGPLAGDHVGREAVLPTSASLEGSRQVMLRLAAELTFGWWPAMAMRSCSRR